MTTSRIGPGKPELVRVFHVITGFDTGGAERVLLKTVRRLDPTRFESTIISLRGRGPLSNDVDRAGVRAIYLNMGRRPTPATLWRLATLFRRANVGIVHAYLYTASIAARLAGRLARVPVVLTSTRAPLAYLPRFAWWLDRVTASWCNRIIAVSQHTAETIVRVEGIPRQKVIVIPNGVDLTRFTPRDRQQARANLGINGTPFVIASIGRLSAEKGQDYLIEALVAIRSRIAHPVCLFAGGGPLRDKLESQARLASLDSTCRFLGEVVDVESVFAAADVVVLPSLFEGMPNVVLEAMAMGRPVIASAVGGSTELVRHGETGLLIPPADSAALAHALVSIASSAERRQQMGVRAREVAEAEYGIDGMIRSVENLYLDEWHRFSKSRSPIR